MGWMEDMKETDVRVCVGAVLILTRDCRRGGPPLVLLGKRDPKRAFYPGAWEVLGGHLEPGENAEQALVRELREEAGVITTEWHRLGEGPEPFPGGDGSIVLHLYAVTSWNGVPRNHAPEEHSEVSCFAVGCSSLGTISGRFTELVGVSPSVYRCRAARATAGMPSCVVKQVTIPVRNREVRARGRKYTLLAGRSRTRKNLHRRK
jgi:8-oxo-dGTP pyrophosphatase MutT (NUDIX family)